MKIKIKAVKFILISAFLFLLAYVNKDKIPYPVELKTMDFIISGGVDIDLDVAENEERCSISYVTDEQKSAGGESSSEPNSNSGKKLFNIKSNTLYRTIDKLQSITNKSLSSSHLEYVLIGEKTARNSLKYFTEHYSKTPKMRLDVSVFVVKDLTSEEFFKNALTSDININDRLDGIVNDREQLSHLTKKNLKDLLQIIYSKNQTGVIPVISIVESPEKKTGAGGDESKSESESEDNSDDASYTFGFYGIGIIKDGGLIDYLPFELVRSYLVLTGGVKNTAIEIKEPNEDETENLFVFQIENSSSKTSFEFDKEDNPSKVIFTVNFDTSYEESDSMQTDDISVGSRQENLNELQADAIRDEIEQVIAISKELDTDFLGIGETLSIQHPYKWHSLEKDWKDIFKDLEYEIDVSIKTKRYYNIR